MEMDGGGFSHKDDDFTFSVNGSGTARIATKNMVIDGLRWQLRLADGRLLTSDCETADPLFESSAVSFSIAIGNSTARVHNVWIPVDGGLHCSVELENTSAEVMVLDSLTLSAGGKDGGISFDGDHDLWSLYKMGFNVSSPSGMVPLTSVETRFHLRFPPVTWLPRSLFRMLFSEKTSFEKEPGRFSSEWFMALTAPDHLDTLVAGFSGVEQNFSRVRIDVSGGTFGLESLLDKVTLDPGERRVLDPMVFLGGPTTDKGLKAYARAVAKDSGARKKAGRIWCSWYSGFYDRVDSKAIAGNLEALGDAGSPIRQFQLDDGYQAAIGDWLMTNQKFPEGLAVLARAISAMGFEPGIWTAPFAVSPQSQLFSKHPDWVVRDARGKPVKAGFIMGHFGPRYYYGLDTTLPAVLEHLENLYRTLYEMGWRLFKVDFLTAASVPGIRHDPKATQAQAYRAGLRAVRRGVGEDGVMLAGIGPVMANAGIMDIQRLGPDTAFGKPVFRSWIQRFVRDQMSPCIANNIAGSLARSFTNDILWSGDGDAIITDGLETSEARLLATVCLMTGSTVTIGHDFTKNQFDFNAINDIAGSVAGTRVADRATRFVPRHVVTDGRWKGVTARFYAILNPTEELVRMLPRADAISSNDPVQVYEYWSASEVVLDPTVAVEIPSKSVHLYVITLG